jgi:hypothetical protein
MVETAARGRGNTPIERLLGVSDVMDDLINRADRPARAFVVRLGRVSAGPPQTESEQALVTGFRRLVAGLATEAALSDIDEFARSWWILFRGTLLQAVDGDLESARLSRHMVADLVERHRVPVVSFSPVTEELTAQIDFDAQSDDASESSA